MNRTSIGFSPLNTATTLDFQLPNTTFPDTVKEILLYATVRCGYSNQQPTTVTEIPFYVEENGIQYAKFLNMINYPQNAWNTNSDNMWFPLPSNRMVYVHVPTALTGYCETSISAIGYR